MHHSNATAKIQLNLQFITFTMCENANDSLSGIN